MKIYHVYAWPTDLYDDDMISYGYYSSQKLAKKRVAELKKKRLVAMEARGREPSETLDMDDRYDHPDWDYCVVNEDENDEYVYDSWAI